MGSCGLWEVWNRRNAKLHGDRDYNFMSKMHKWASKLTCGIPGGLESRREVHILNIKQYCMQKPIWNRWRPCVHGIWLHIAIITTAECCKDSALYRGHQGRFIRALVQTFPKSRPDCEFIQFVDIAIGEANRMKINVRHIISTHYCSFRYKKLQELDVLWEVLNEIRRTDRDHGLVDFHSVVSNINNAAICLAYSVDNMVVNTLSELPLAVRQSIRADRLGLPALCSEEDMGLWARSNRFFLKNMGTGLH